MPRVAVLLVLSALSACESHDAGSGKATVEWTHYAGDAAGTKYSPAAAIHRKNVASLKLAWQIRVGDLPPEAYASGASAGPPKAFQEPPPVAFLRFESTPVQKGGKLFLSTPLNRVLALDPITGGVLWEHDPGINRNAYFPEGFTSRGVAVWVADSTPVRNECTTRIFAVTVDARLIALDGENGSACVDFGQNGTVHLAVGAGAEKPDAAPRHLSVTSPPTVVDSFVIVGSTVRESADADRPSAVVRAFDVRSGVLRWSFHPITKGAVDLTLKSPQKVVASSISGANVWSIISADAERDLVFLPTSSASPDFYGGGRIGRNDFANSVVALRASTGAVVWAFQTVHHDLWDYDVAAQPMLATITRDGQRVDVVIIGTKAGMIFVLDRDKGVPILPVEERAVPPSDVPGEVAWRTQPFSVHPPPLLGTRLTPDSAFGVDSSDLAYCRAALADLRNDGLFTPPSLQGSLEWPGFWGGINWDGLAWDPARERFVTTLKRVAMAVRLHPRDDSAVRSPSDLGREVIQQAGTPYRATRGPLVAPSGNPCTPPPWGSLVSVDVSGIDATVRWTRPLGTVPWLSNFPNYREWGSLVFGGPLITAGGLVFVAATQDDMFRAFDIDSGEELWAAKLPAGGQASPMTYVIDGKQFVVIAAGGRSGIGSPGDYIVAFSLP